MRRRRLQHANTITVVDDPVGIVDYGTGIAIGADGLPVVSDHDRTAGVLKVALCGTPACSAGNLLTIVDDRRTRTWPRAPPARSRSVPTASRS